MLLRSGALFSALAFAGAAATAEPRAPTGKWNVDFADAQCVAHRDYGAGPGSPKLILKAPAIGDVMQVAILRDSARSEPAQVGATLAIDERPPLKASMTMFSPKDSKQRVYLLNMPSADFALVRRARTLSVRSQGLNETFALSSMEPLMKVMDDCVADLKRVFNVAPAGTEPAALPTRAKANLVDYFRHEDYPEVALEKGQTGKVQFALLIQEDGRVADCTIVAPSGVAALDSQACAMLKARAKFEPARGHDGKPAKDATVGAVTWRINDDSTPKPSRIQ
jgi:TonB family protein